MRAPPASRIELLQVFEQVAGDFDQAQRQVDNREKNIKEALDSLDRLRSVSPWDYSNFPSEHPFLSFAKACQKCLDERFEEWISKVRDYDRNTHFRSTFGDSLLIFVYGKVKAGKSSLGNYLAYGRTEPDPQLIADAELKPIFFSETSTNLCEQTDNEQIRLNGRFGVDVVEATSSIQGFRLPGMTWIDSPGLHSVNAANGKLTKGYVDCADLVIFLSNSESPGRRSDLEEAVGLLRKGKNVTVLITGSDTTDVDVDDEGELVKRLIMKGDGDRQQQISYVTQAIRESAPDLTLDKVRVHSISACYAEAGTAEEQAGRWRDSGLAGFAADIERLARAEGLQIKRQVPMKNLQTFCYQLRESIKFQKVILSDMHCELAKARKDLQGSIDQILSQLQQRLPEEIDRLADAHLQDDQAFSAASWALFDQLYAQCVSQLCLAIGQKFEDVSHTAQSMAPVGKVLPGFASRTRRVEYQSRRNEGIGKAGGAGLGTWGGAKAGAALGTMVSPGAGTMIGGLIGAALGGWFGGALGGVAGSQFNESGAFDIVVGDNRDEVSLITREHFFTHAEDRLNRLYSQLDRLCFVDISSWLHQLHHALKGLDELANQNINEIQKELTYGTA